MNLRIIFGRTLVIRHGEVYGILTGRYGKQGREA